MSGEEEERIYMRAGAMLPTQLCWLTQSFRVLCLLLGLCANSALGDECGCDNREALHTLRQATLVEGRVTQAKLIEGAARSIKFVLEPWREAKVEGRRPMTLIATLPERPEKGIEVQSEQQCAFAIRKGASSPGLC